MTQPTFLLIAMLFLLHTTLAFGQPTEIKLWPTEVPGQYLGQSGEKSLVDKNVLTHVSKVTNPTLTVYQANVGPGERSKAVIICPGGGYSRLSIEKEGHAVAKYLAENGITGIVLKNRLPDDSLQLNKTIVPLLDARQAIRLARENAEQWNLDPHFIGIMGFSAGGHLAATASTRRPYFEKEGENLRPDFSILIYPVISMKTGLTHGGSRDRLLGKNPSDTLILEYSNEEQVSEQTPPTFLVHSFDDKAVPIENSLNYIKRLREYGIACEAHLYPSGGHGYGMLPGRTDSWPGLMVKWIRLLK